MQIITKPTVTVVGTPVFISHPDYDIPNDGDDITKLCSFAAKGCYDSYGVDGRSNEANQRGVLDHAHGSVAEHAHISLFIEGITRGLSLELNRHRTFNISQRSTRYTREEDSAIVLDPEYARLYQKWGASRVFRDGAWHWDFVNIPSHFLTETDELEIDTILKFLTASDQSLQAYANQVELLIKRNPLNLTGFDLRKWARGKARNLLPHGLETRGTWTNNLRGFRWFIESRSDRHAEPEIRVLADVVLQALRTVSPLYFEDFEVIEVYDDIPVWRPKYRKV